MNNLPIFRTGTTDELAWKETVVRNDYFLPDHFAPDDVVIDVGAHIGCFSLAALNRGAGRVWAFEADAANFALAVLNLRAYRARVSIEHAAVWRSDKLVSHLYFGGYDTWKDGMVNTGGGDVLHSTQGVAVRTMALDDIIDLASKGGSHRIRLIKFDCEGSEYPILLTSERLHLVDEITGEYHVVEGDRWLQLSDDARVDGFSRYRGADLRAHLERHGFTARTGHDHPKLGQFIAWRT